MHEHPNLNPIPTSPGSTGSQPDPDLLVDPAQAARVAARRREVQAGETSNRGGQLVTGGLSAFAGSCMHCNLLFEYRAPAWVGPDGKPRPSLAPRRVCDRPECQTAEVERVKGERVALDAEVHAAYVDRRDRDYSTIVPPKYHRDAAIEAACEAHIVPELRGWDYRQSLYLHGKAGRGKDHQVAALLHRVAGHHTFAWISTRELIDDAKAAIGNRDRTRPAIIDNPCGVAVLVLNDVFAEVATEFSASTIGSIVDRRYNAGLPVVWTSNVAPSTILKTVNGQRADASIVSQELERHRSRIMEMTSPGRGIMHRLDGRDWRVAMADGEFA